METTNQAAAPLAAGPQREVADAGVIAGGEPGVILAPWLQWPEAEGVLARHGYERVEASPANAEGYAEYLCPCCREPGLELRVYQRAPQFRALACCPGCLAWEEV